MNEMNGINGFNSQRPTSNAQRSTRWVVVRYSEWSVESLPFAALARLTNSRDASLALSMTDKGEARKGR